MLCSIPVSVGPLIFCVTALRCIVFSPANECKNVGTIPANIKMVKHVNNTDFVREFSYLISEGQHNILADRNNYPCFNFILVTSKQIPRA